MRLYVSQTTDPAINLATEEYLFRNYSDEIILLYINQSSLIAGKHQNVLAEVNFPYCYKNNIPLFRRISGGGTVYHGDGNVNFSFIFSRGKRGLNYHENLIPLQKFFKEILNLDIEISTRNDLWLHSKKISGTAEHVFKNRVLQHGTLLYNSSLDDLRKALHKSGDHYTGKAVASVCSETTNIANHLKTPYPLPEFLLLLSEYLKKYFSAKELFLTKNEHKEIRELANTKYRSRKWNFAYSGKYAFEKTTIINSKKYEVELKVEHGVITESTIRIDSEPVSGISLKGIGHYPSNLMEALEETALWSEIKEAYLEMFF